MIADTISRLRNRTIVAAMLARLNIVDESSRTVGLRFSPRCAHDASGRDPFTSTRPTLLEQLSHYRAATPECDLAVARIC